jgi:uncharacterized phiE125 gp8 family phage protein
MDATTTARVKALLDITSSTHDTVLGTMIAAASRRIENYIDRPLETTARTETYPMMPRQSVLFLRAYPVTAIASIKVSAGWDFAAATAISSSDYYVDSESGMVNFNHFPIVPGILEGGAAQNAVQVVYTAGLAADVATLISDYPDIAYAADAQVVAMWRRRDSPQGSTYSVGGSSMTYEVPLKMVPDVVEALTPYRRLRFAANG